MDRDKLLRMCEDFRHCYNPNDTLSNQDVYRFIEELQAELKK